jgi:hypothetical protein
MVTVYLTTRTETGGVPCIDVQGSSSASQGVMRCLCAADLAFLRVQTLKNC